MQTAKRLRGLAILLGVLLILLEIGHTRETWREWMQRDTIPAAPGIFFQNGFGTVERVAKEWESYGIRAGDRIATVNGREFRGEAFLRRMARRQAPGSEVVVAVQREGTPERTIRLKLPARTGKVDWDDRVLAFFIEIFSRWSCLLLGLYVLLVRPADVLAWIVFGMLVGFARVAATLPAHYADRWPEVFQGAAIFLDTFVSATWPAYMMLFGILFPDPRSKVRLLGWARFVLGPLLFVLATAYAVTNVLSAFAAADLSFLSVPLGWTNYPMIGASFFAVSIFFMNIPYKAAKEKNPDSRRRLRLFFWGANVTLMPVLILVICRVVLGDLEKLPAWLLVGLLVIVTFFPVVVGYVLVVERAMDVRVVVRSGLQYALATRGVRIAQALLTALVMVYAVEIASGQGARQVARIQTIAYSVMAIVLLGRFAGRVQGWVDRRFFREQHRAEQMLLELGRRVRGVIEPERLRRLVTDTVRDALHVERVELSLNGAASQVPADLRLPLEAGAQQIGWLLLGPKRNEEPYSRNDIRLLENVASQTALAMDNARLASAVAQEAAQRERIQREIELCREVQERIFPQKKPAVPGLEYEGVYRPAETVGGDCFEYMVDPRGRLWLAIGDVAGKGVSAALLMAGVNAALRGLLSAGVSEVGDVFNHLNRVLYDSTPRNRFVTLLLARFDPEDRRLVYASAGHCPMLVVRAGGEAEWLTTRGVGLGLSGKSRYLHAETTLEPGDAFLLYTDGVTEARNLAGEDFGEDRLRHAISGATARDLAVRVLEEVERFAGGAPQHDDITLLAARCTG